MKMYIRKAGFVKLAGDQTIAGNKTFTGSAIFINGNNKITISTAGGIYFEDTSNVSYKKSSLRNYLGNFLVYYDNGAFAYHEIKSSSAIDFNGTGNITLFDGKNIAVGTTTGTKLGTGTTQKLSFWNATPIVQPTTSVTASTFVANSGTAVNDASTFDGYTIGKVVKALRNIGLLA